ncbi:MAG: hypothetical protein WCE62_18805 [Polyangiales bacterium]
MRSVFRRGAALLSIVALLSVGIGVARAQDIEILTEPPPPTERSPQAVEPPNTLTLELGGALAPQAEQDHLDEWLEYAASASRFQRLTQGSTMLVAGTIVMGIGIPLYLLRNPGTELDKGLGLAAIAVSGACMGLGIVKLASKSAVERQLERWQAAKDAGLTPRELARFEGELRNYGELARRSVLVERWTSFAMALTGGLMIGLTPAADLSRDGATIGYAGGGIFLGAGLLEFGRSFRKRAVPDYWETYLSGKRPPPSLKWSASPAVGHQFAGANVAARF